MLTSNYAGYHGKQSGEPVAISLTVPSWFEGRTYPQLAPTPKILAAYHKGMSQEDYRQQYREQVLSRLDPQEVYDDLKGCVVLCFEAPGQFCHRRLVAEWIQERLGVKVPEWTKNHGFLGD